ncbi:hypothetical protein RhiirA1_473628 [Rhizophagus irregularis]|uniref:Uncharacterized protein n=1 Tax=Rhizophagus irregularis TaxID=588596 RepID=A0A2N0R068_9GLOM|nr:hypothetical protein RhiirA1_473628 [Rhizophagus irregularis]CAB4493680.1 unnamed protein product [Rhizophagus irregularis]CAB5394642.1 unnamed protein product [Rhizophagus irregularis]
MSRKSNHSHSQVQSLRGPQQTHRRETSPVSSLSPSSSPSPTPSTPTIHDHGHHNQSSTHVQSLTQGQSSTQVQSLTHGQFSTHNQSTRGIVKPPGSVKNICKILHLDKRIYQGYRSDLRDLIKAGFLDSKKKWIDQDMKQVLIIIKKFKDKNPSFPKCANDWAIKEIMRSIINNKREYSRFHKNKQTRPRHKNNNHQHNYQCDHQHDHQHDDHQHDDNDHQHDDHQHNQQRPSTATD